MMMEKVLLRFIMFPDETSEYTVIRTHDDVTKYMDILNYETTINSVNLTRKGGSRYFDGVARLQDMYQTIYRGTLYPLSHQLGKTTDEIISKGVVMSIKERIMRDYINNNHVLYINHKGGMLPHNDKLEIIKTWYEETV
jgi:hypothetical protein